MNYLPTCRQYLCRKQAIGVLVLLVVLSTSLMMITHVIDCTHGSAPIVMRGSDGRSVETSAEKMTKNDVMLLSYGRSGSSFTSGVISYHPDVFFFFEPLYGLEVQGGNNTYFINTKEDLSKKIIKSFFTCNFTMDTFYLFGSKLFNHSNSTYDFHHCFREMRPGVDHLSCLYDMFMSCRSHSTVLIKTIRYRVKWTESLLQTRPNFKLLLLYRDPRATLYSQSTAIKNFNWSVDLVNVSNTHCRRLQEDLQEAKRLKQLYPGRVKCIRYEDGVADPHSYTRGIYQFLGLSLNQRVLDYVRNLTNAKGKRTEYRFGIERDAKLAMSTWRYQADFDSIQLIDRTCGHLYADLGYLMVSSAEDLKSTRPLLVTPPAGIIFQ